MAAQVQPFPKSALKQTIKKIAGELESMKIDPRRHSCPVASVNSELDEPIKWLHASSADPTVLVPYSPALAELLERSYQKGEAMLRFRVRKESGDNDAEPVEVLINFSNMSEKGPSGARQVMRVAPHSHHKKSKRHVNVGTEGNTWKQVMTYEVPDDDDFDW